MKSELKKGSQDIPVVFKELFENYSPTNAIAYTEFLKTKSIKEVLEHSVCVFTEPLVGINYLIESITEVPEKLSGYLEDTHSKLTAYRHNAIINNYDNHEHLEKLNECISVVEKRIKYFNSDEYLLESTVNAFDSEIEKIDEVLMEEFRADDKSDLLGHVSVPLNEQAEWDDLESNEVTEELFMDILREGPDKTTGEKIGKLISKNPITHVSATAGRNLAVGILIKKHGEEEGIKIAIQNGKKAIIEFEKMLKKFHKSKGLGKAGHALLGMDSVHLSAQIHIIEKGNEQLEKRLKRVRADKKILKEHIGTMSPDIIYEDTMVEDDDRVQVLKKRVELQFNVEFAKVALDSSDEIALESFNELSRLANEYAYLSEGLIAITEKKEVFKSSESMDILTENKVNGALKKAAIKGDQVSRKLANASRKSMDEGRRVKVIASKIPGHFEALVNNSINKVKQMDVNERRKRIMEGGFRFKLFKLIRNAILLGGAAAINPALAAIGFLVHFALDKQVDRKVRQNIVKELREELAIVTEKIEDAKGDQNKSKKYQLMRIKTKLENDIERIQYNLDHISVGPKGIKI